MTDVKSKEKNIIDAEDLEFEKFMNNPKFLNFMNAWYAKKQVNDKSKEEIQEPEMELDKMKDGTVKNTNNNLQQILQFDPNLRGKLGYNLATQEYTIIKDIKLPAKQADGSSTKVVIPAGKLDDTGLNMLVNYLSNNKNYKIETDRNRLMTAMTWIQQVQTYDPLKDYFNALDWDGKDRISHVMRDYLGAEDSDFNKFEIKLWLMGAVSKVYNKKQKFDFVLDLVGGQGAGKTTFLQKLSPLGMYVQDFPDFDSKDTKMMLKGALIANDDEMNATKNSSFEQIKSFVTATSMEFRVPYGRLPISVNKSFVLARTGNEIQHLSDPSGQRRFLCIQCGVHDDHKVVYTDLSQEYVDQLWAQAKHYYDEAKDRGNLFGLTKEQDEMLNNGRQMFIKTNNTQDVVKDLLRNELSNANFVSNADMRRLTAHALGKDGIGPNDRELRSVRVQMAHSGWLASALGWDAELGKMVRGYKRINKITVNRYLWGVKEWITSECDHKFVTNGKQRPVFANPEEPEVSIMDNSGSLEDYYSDKDRGINKKDDNADDKQTENEDDLPF